MAKQITAGEDKAIAAGTDRLLIRDMTSGTDKDTSVSGLANALAPVVTTDANGWKVYDYVTHKRYTFQKSNNNPFAMPAGQLNLDNIPMPVGVLDFRTKNPQVTLSTSNAQVVLGGYIGGATPDFNTFSIFAYNTGAGITLNYWHMFIGLTV